MSSGDRAFAALHHRDHIGTKARASSQPAANAHTYPIVTRAESALAAFTGEATTIRVHRAGRHRNNDLGHHAYTNGTEARAGLTCYFSFYNARRSHQSLDYRTPDEVYFDELAVSTLQAA